MREQHFFPQFSQFSRVLPGPERIHENIFVNEPITAPPCGTVTTVYENLKRGVVLSENGPCYGEIKDGQYEWTNYQQVIDTAHKIGSAVVNHGVIHGGLAGLAGIHSTNFQMAMFGLVSQGISLVPLYHNSKEEVLCEIVDACQLSLIFCDSVERTESFIEKKRNGGLQTVTTLVTLTSSHSGAAAENNNNQVEGLKVYDFETFVRLGEANPVEPSPPSPDDVYLICHTSGTTGRPKGVQLTHRNLLAAMAGLYTQWCPSPHNFCFGKNDTYFSFLSLAHVYEHLMQAFMMYNGSRMGIYSGDVKRMMTDIQLLQPTIISLVPRILNRLYDQVHSNVAKSHFLARTLFSLAMRSKTDELRRGILNPNTFWDKLVFEKVRAVLGGNVRLLTTGGAPVMNAVHDFTRIAFGVPLFEGYGQTECGAAGTLNIPGDLNGGQVGAPAPWSQVKLVDVADMNYFSKDDKGEVCFRGAAVMKGYYGDEELTRKNIDAEGWLHTGDIGQWLPDGRLQIVDRKNSLFKLSQGDFVSPEAVESIYMLDPLVNQIFVTGQSTRSFLVGISVVDPTALRQAIENSKRQELQQHLPLPDEEIVKKEVVKKFVLSQLTSMGKAKGLQTIEQIRQIHLILEEWTAESGLLTPTLKIRRQPCRDNFQKEIDQMYSAETTLAEKAEND